MTSHPDHSMTSLNFSGNSYISDICLLWDKHASFVMVKGMIKVSNHTYMVKGSCGSGWWVSLKVGEGQI